MSSVMSNSGRREAGYLNDHRGSNSAASGANGGGSQSGNQVSSRSSSSDPLIRHQQLTDNVITNGARITNYATPPGDDGSPILVPHPTLSTSAAALCAAVPGLVKQQLQVCEAHPNAMLAVR